MSSPEQRLAEIVARVADGEEAGKLHEQALARLAYRRRHSGKTCSSCHSEKPLSAFGPDGARPDGFSHRCRACDSARKRAARRSV